MRLALVAAAPVVRLALVAGSPVVRLALVAGMLGLSLGCAIPGLPMAGYLEPTPAPVAAPPTSARLQVEMWSGFEARAAPLPPYRTALVVDANGAMSNKTQEGRIAHILAGRLAAQRFVDQLSGQVPLDVYVVAGSRDATCDTFVSDPLPGSRDAVGAALGRLRAQGKGSIRQALLALADSPDELDRVVLVSNLYEECGDSICDAAAALAARGTRLDVVAIGDVIAPVCLDAVVEAQTDARPVPWTSERARRYHVQTTGDDPAVLHWGLVNDLPLEVGPGEYEIVVELEPPLRVSRDFAVGERWKLEVLDFPGLDAPQRQWRWRRMDLAPPATADAGASE